MICTGSRQSLLRIRQNIQLNAKTSPLASLFLAAIVARPSGKSLGMTVLAGNIFPNTFL
tara:strand:+ start:8420 stop:8596 length:177 start_codon:yes stop_codon:yes gene_type:complete